MGLFIVIPTLTGCSGGGSESANTMLSGNSQSPQASGSQGQQSSSSAGSQQPIKPEQLISKEEAATLIGEAVKEGAPGEYPMLGLSICFYAAENADSKNYLQIAVIQQGAGSGQSGSGESSQPSASSQSSESSQASQSQSGGSDSQSQSLSPRNLYEGFKKLFSDPYASVSGRIGDDTFLSAQGMSILSGEYYIYIAAGSPNAQDTQKILKQAGELAINNLRRIQGE